MAELATNQIPKDIRNFLEQQGLWSNLKLLPLLDGANNRVFHIECDKGDYVLKAYYQNPNDLRDRFTTERTFYEFLWQSGIRQIPQPIAWDSKYRLGLISYAIGRKLLPAELGLAQVDAALDFIRNLNQNKQTAPALQIGLASEACLSIDEHLACVAKRIQRLNEIARNHDIDNSAHDFIQNDLKPKWRSLHRSLLRSARISGLNCEVQLDRSEQVLSPSDFGFHNALIGPDSRMVFLDFEYAGWDDPAKLVCDFFCQPQIPVAYEHWNYCLNKLQAGLSLEATFSQRARLLLPLYGIKWCCIMLNEFLPIASQRRKFAGKGLKEIQLSKAKYALENLVE
jgi:hypothetical protein